jgi:hypothetical protein
VVVDDKRARALGESMGLNLARAVTVIFEFLKLKVIGKSLAGNNSPLDILESWVLARLKT